MQKMVKFIVVRHGYSVYNRDVLFAGQCDIPLDERGLEQAQDTSNYIIKNYRIDKIYSSDLIRAYNTVKPVADALHLPIITDKGLREVDVGFWGGRAFDDIKKEYPQSAALYKENVGLVRFDGGENYIELQDRTLKAFEKIARENEGKTILVATHGGVLRALCCAWLGFSLEEISKVPRTSNASITTVDYENGQFVLKTIGYNEHLSCKVTEAPLTR